VSALFDRPEDAILTTVPEYLTSPLLISPLLITPLPIIHDELQTEKRR
jgi:hypothetical protein